LKRVRFISHSVTKYLEHDRSGAMLHASLIDSPTLHCPSCDCRNAIIAVRVGERKLKLLVAGGNWIWSERSAFRIARSQKG
jgi:hypothetical protein